jgi:ParB-like chromosome segregation protein Spo0J
MPGRVHTAFDPQGIMLPIDKILPLKRVDPKKKSKTFNRIAAALREVGLVEPLIVYPQGGKSGMYLLLDGNQRFEAMKTLGANEVFCLIASEDEAFTYNHKVNQVSPIQEHFMILKAIENGVSEERIARALDVDVGSIRRKRDLLKGVCPEVVQLLKEKRAAPGALRELRRVKPMRQIEMAELMVASNNFSASYAKCLIAATPQDQLMEPERPKEVRGLKPEDAVRMEKEMETLGADFRLIQESHGRNVLNLVLAVTYLRKLLDNAALVRYLSQRHADILGEFQKVVESTSLDGGG